MVSDLVTLLFVALSPAPQTIGGAAPAAPPRAFRPQLELRDFDLSTPSSLDEPATTVGSRELVLVSENAMVVDLNGDGDQIDNVLQSVDLRTGVVTNLGLASQTSFAFDPAQPEHVLVFVSEIRQGNQDLNGDGDRMDSYVLFDVDLATGTARNSGFAAYHALVSGDWAAITVFELDQGALDLNGDGVVGEALFRWDLSAAGSPVDASSTPYRLQAAHESYFLFTVAETVGGADLNGDGDTADRVLQALHGPTGNITNIGLATLGFAERAVAKGPYSVLMAFEGGQGQDLNGDGDKVDQVPHVFSLLTGQLVNLGVNLTQPIVNLGHGSLSARAYAISDEGFAFHVSEPAEGGVDLNGDGDVTDNDVLFVHVFATGLTRNLRLSVWNFEFEDGLLAMQVGKYGGLVVQIHDLAQNTTWNLGIPTFPNINSNSKTSFRIRGEWVAVVAWESSEDHTGDGLESGHYLVLASERPHQIIDTGMALSQANEMEWSLVFQDAGVLTALAYERDMATDLNGDGDIQDQVVRIFQPDLGFELDTGQSASILLPGYRQNYPFIAREAHDAADHNGDGDALDTVLRVARLKLR